MNKTFSDYLMLTKPRICALAMIMASLGFFIGNGNVDWSLFFWSQLGIALVGAASGVLNQYIEKEVDGHMWRTLDRPLPSGRMLPQHALAFGLGMAFGGEILLLIAVNPVTAVLGALTLLFYLGIYTPAKRISSVSTLIGAIPGAMPPLLGFTASKGTVTSEGMLLFAILFLWQIPHFLAIAWIYKEDYARGSMPVLPVIDEEGWQTAWQIILYNLVLLPITLIPSAWGLAGKIYFYGAIALGLIYLSQGIAMAMRRTKVQARRLFLTSLVYLPALGILLAWDRL